MSKHAVVLRSPVLADATGVFDLVDCCKPLDLNSHYLYLLQCSHFSSSCVVGELDHQVQGWVSGYVPPEQPEVFFVWQVAVGPLARGQGLARRLIEWLLIRHPQCKQLHTSITPDNEASWALFKGLARRWNTQLTSSDWFEKQAHFAGRHDTEVLVQIDLPQSFQEKE